MTAIDSSARLQYTIDSVVDSDSNIAGIVAEEAIEYLDAPIKKVTPPHTPVPFSPSLEQLYLPNAERISTAVRETLQGL